MFRLVFFPNISKLKNNIENMLNDSYDYMMHGRKMNMYHLHAKENVQVSKNSFVYIKVKKQRIEEYSIMINCSYLRHALGHVVGAGEDVFLPISAERVIDKVLFAVAEDGKIKKKDLLGVIYSIKVEPHEK